MPRDQISRYGGNRITIDFVGDTRVEGVLGEAGTPWGAKTIYASSRRDLQGLLRGAVPSESIPRSHR